MLRRIETRLSRLEKNQQLLLNEEKEVIDEEKAELAKQQEEVDELKTLEELEKSIDKDVKVNPLTKISARDFYKSVIGAFIGIMGHFSFFYGVEIAHDITMTRAVVLYLVSFLIGIMYVYFAGFRKVKIAATHKFIPLRVLTIYITSLAVIIIVLYLFGFAGSHTGFEELFKTVSTISILAVLGASTADLIGRESDEH